MSELVLPRIMQPKDVYTFDYPVAVEFADKQNSVFWPFHEAKVEKDIQDVLVNLEQAERHGVITTLKLFTKYELIVGNEYWGGKVKRWFPRPDIGVMADCFAYFETNVHARFYNRINELLHINTEEFYNSYINDETLSARMSFLEEVLDQEDDKPLSLAIFAMVEGAILYSSFAFLKHFQSQGKNKLKNLVAGINFSVRDENLHHEGGAWLFRQLITELRMSIEDLETLYTRIYAAADKLREHEHRICDMIFEKGRIEGITAYQLKNFVDSRLDLCLQNLGLTAIYKPSHNPIAEWFYDGISSNSVIHDFFDRQGNQYNRNWSPTEFAW